MGLDPIRWDVHIRGKEYVGEVRYYYINWSKPANYMFTGRPLY